ncbi:MAG: glycosyltransferase [Acidimicrobiia bacterium]
MSVLIPTRNEARHIEACVAAVAAQDFPLDRLEVVVVDGCSQDGTPEAAARALAGHGFARTEVVTNPEATTPSNLNAGLAAVRGTYVCRVDARSLVPPDYVRRCIAVLAARPEVVVVGGSQRALPPRRGAVGAGIARALNNRWAMGLSRYRRGAPSGPSDTVYLGAFRTADLRAVGGWRLDFPTNQDFELNRRLGRTGTVWFESGLEVGYVPRDSIGALFAQYRRFGRWKWRYWRTTGDRPRPRQMVLLASPLPVGAALLLAVRRGRAGGVATLASLGAAALAAAEALGSDEPDAGPAGHAAGMVAMAAVGLGWLTGVAAGALERVGRRTTPR